MAILKHMNTEKASCFIVSSLIYIFLNTLPTTIFTLQSKQYFIYTSNLEKILSNFTTWGSLNLLLIPFSFSCRIVTRYQTVIWLRSSENTFHDNQVSVINSMKFLLTKVFSLNLGTSMSDLLIFSLGRKTELPQKLAAT